MKGRGAKGLAILALLLPGVGFLTVFFGIPVCKALVVSIVSGSGGKGATLSLAKYAEIFTSKLYRDGLSFTLYLSIVPLFASLLISVPLASLLQKGFVGKKLFSVLYKLPLVVPAIVAAFMMMLILDAGGWLYRLLSVVGIRMPRLVRDGAAIGVIVASVWKNVPFMTLIIGGGMASINPEVLEAARSLGASALGTFFKVQIPLALPGITASSLLVFIGSMGSFSIPKLLGPVYPLPLSVYMYEQMALGNWPLVFAMGSLLSALSVAVLLAYYRITMRAHQALTVGR